jgi:hypothetical protein
MKSTLMDRLTDMEQGFIPHYLASDPNPSARKKLLEEYVQDQQLSFFEIATLCAAIKLYKIGSSPQEAIDFSK